MKRTLLCAALLLAAIHFPSFAQEPDPPATEILSTDSNRNFDIISRKYLEDMLLFTPSDSVSEARIHKQYGRWQNFWQNRVCVDAPDSVSIFAPSQMAVEYTFVQPWPEEGGSGGIWDIDPEPPIYWPPLGDPYPPVCLNNAGGDWKLLGPKYDHFNKSRDTAGRVSSLWVSPSDSNYILAGSAAGGLWKTTDGGANWKNITDSASYLAMGTLGVSGIAVHPNFQDRIWLNTGMYNITMTYNMFGGDDKYNTGFIFSTDGGATWKDDRAFKSKITLLYPHDYTSRQIYKIDYSPATKKLYTSYRKRIFVRGDDVTHTNDHNIWRNISPPGLNALGPDFMITDFEFTTNPMGNVVFSTNNVNGYQYLFILNEADTSYTDWIQKTIYTDSFVDNGNYFQFGINDLALNNSDSAYMRIRAFNSKDAVQDIENRLYRTDLSPSGSVELVNGALAKDARVMKISPSNPATIYLLESQNDTFLYRSDNYGATFPFDNNARTHADGRCMVIRQSSATAGGLNDELYFGTDGGVSKKSKGSTTFRSLTGKGFDMSLCYGVHSSPTYEGLIITGTADNGTHAYIAHSPGNKWTGFSWADGTLGGFARNGELRAYSQSQSSFKKNATFSLTNASMTNGSTLNPIDGDHHKWMRPVKFGRNNTARTGWWFIWRNQAATLNSMNWTTAFGVGSTPIFNHREPKPPIHVDSIAWKKAHKHTNDFIIADKDTNIAYIAYGRLLWQDFVPSAYSNDPDSLHGKLYYTFNGGNNWFNRTPPNLVGLQITDIDIDQKDPLRIWASYGNINWDELNKPAAQRTRRVFYSSNAGVSWTDISKGLPPVPVNKIVYVQGSDNVLFAGTDIGVYRWNDAAQQWECFNSKGIPRGMVNDLEMHYCSGKLRAAVFGRGIYETDWKPNQHYFSDIAGFTNEINNNETWATDRDIDGSIHVKPGKTLIIDGATIYMARNARILVDRNAILELKNGAKLTNGCTGVTWSGIEVAGNLAFGQSDKPSKGWLKISGNSIIENARIGVTDYTATYGNEGGGYLEINGATFLNCYRGIALNNYPVFQNRCQFNNITFTTDNNYYVPEHVNEPRFFTSWNEKGFSITNSTFQDLRSSVHMDKRFTGVHTGNSGYTVQSCDFAKLRRGVNAINELDLPDRTVYVRNCDFDTLKEGVNIVKLSGGIYNNNFTFHNTVTTSAGIANILWQKEWGVMLHHWRGSLVQDNAMSGKSIFPSNPLQYGIISSSEGYNNPNVANLSYNTFYRLVSGVQTQGTQQRTYIFCNSFSNNTHGITINPESLWGSLNHQGSGLNADTENRPTNTLSSNSIAIGCWLNTGPVNYYATTDLPNTVPPNVFNPGGGLNLITGPLTGTWAYETSCDRMMVEPDNSTWTDVGDAVADFGTLVSARNRHTNEAVALYNWILMAYSKWDTTESSTHIRTFLEADDHDESRLMLAGLYYNLGETELISTVLAELDGMDTDNKNAIQDYYGFLLTIKSDGRQMNELDSAELVTLNEWADTSLYISSFAKAWLETHYDSVWMHHVEDIPVIDISANIKMGSQASALGNATPNPADRTTSIEVFVAPSDEGRKPTLVLRDAMGREHFRKALNGGYNHVEISTEKLASGIYIYSFVVNNKEVEGKKLSIAR